MKAKMKMPDSYLDMNDNEKELVGGGPQIELVTMDGVPGIMTVGKDISTMDEIRNGYHVRSARVTVRGTFYETNYTGVTIYKGANGTFTEHAEHTVKYMHTDGKFLIGAIAVVGASALACAGMAIYDACTDE